MNLTANDFTLRIRAHLPELKDNFTIVYPRQHGIVTSLYSKQVDKADASLQKECLVSEVNEAVSVASGESVNNFTLTLVQYR